jgi:hypothetical protein
MLHAVFDCIVHHVLAGLLPPWGSYLGSSGTKDVEAMVKGPNAYQLYEGYRGSEPITLKELPRLVTAGKRQWR